MKSFIKELSPLSLLFSLTLASFPLFFRAENLFIELFEGHGVSWWYLVNFLLGGICALVLICLSHSKARAHQRNTLLGGGCLAVGELIALSLTTYTLLPEMQSLLSGLCIGFGFVLLTYEWGVRFCILSPWRVLLNSCFAFLGASVVWFALQQITYPYVLCLCMMALSVLSAAGLVISTHVDFGEETNNFVSSDNRTGRKKSEDVKGDSSLDPDRGLGLGQDHNSEQCFSAGLSPFLGPDLELDSGLDSGLELSRGNPLSTTKELISYVWSGSLGIAFNFFTMGLTFWPLTAGLTPGGATMTKTIAYCIIFLLLCLVQFFTGSPSQKNLELYYRCALPIGAAIVLASPFLDTLTFLQSVPLVSWISYTGIALLYVLGFSVFIWAKQLSKTPYSWLFSCMALICIVGFASGLLVFQLIGQQAQIVSLCILSLYLAMMVFMAIKDGYNEPNQSGNPQHNVLSDHEPDSTASHQLIRNHEQSASDLIQDAHNRDIDHQHMLCQRLAEEYGLSPRENEILEYLARGRSAKYIGDKLFISSATVRTHSKRIYEKMDVHTKDELLDLLENLS